MSGVTALRCTVSGRVQGVGFRSFVHERGTSLGLAGYVRNLPDGRVETAARGPREVLERFLEDLRRGPSSAHVTDVDTVWDQGATPPDGQWPATFEVRL